MKSNRDYSNTFIGRAEELIIFTDWLADAHAPWILYLHDLLEEQKKKGGVGKTWLLRRFAELAQQQYKNIVVVTIDFFNVEARDGVVIAERIVRTLQKTFRHWSPDAFDALLLEYQRAVDTHNIDVVDIRAQLSLALIADLEKLHEQLLRTDGYLLVMFDTFELIEQNPVNAALGLSQTFPDNYQFSHMKVVIAGRNALDWDHPNWRGREQEVRSIALAPFTLEEMGDYINSHSIIQLDSSSLQTQALYERTEGRPILVGLVTDMVNNYVLVDQLIAIPILDFEANIISLISSLGKSVYVTILFMAHAYHRFNVSLLKSILRYYDPTQSPVTLQLQEWWDPLPEFSFVRRAGSENDFVLHDEMRRLLVQHWWDKQDLDCQSRKDISCGAISYYEERIALERNEQVSQVYVVEKLYHKLFLNVDDGLAFFNHHFSSAINLRLNSFGFALLQEAKKFADTLSYEQRFELVLAEAQLLRREERSKDALLIYQSIEREADPEWLEEHRADLLQEKGSCYEQMSAFNEAIANYEACLDTETVRRDETRQAIILRSLGYIQRRRGQLEIAARLYEECVAIHRKSGNLHAYADVLTGMAHLFRLQGKMEEALRRCKIALRIREELFQQGKTSEVSVGLSTSTMGVIYLNTDDLVGAEKAFKEAYEIFLRNGYRKGIATLCNRFGQVEMARGNVDVAMDWFKRGHANSLGVDTEMQINSLNKQGWVWVLRGEREESELARHDKLKKAVPFLEQAIELAEGFYDFYQEAESLIDLADVLGRLELYELSQQALRRGEDIAKRYNYNLLLGIAEEFQGDISYRAGEYQKAFDYFVTSCRYMALYNPIRFNKSLRKLIDTLLSTPREEIDSITTKLITYWLHHGLAKSYPEFISACEEVHDLAVL